MILRLEPVRMGDLDRALVSLAVARLMRVPGALYVEVADEAHERATRALALAGLRAHPAAVPPDHPAGLVMGHGRTLDPAGAVALDIVEVRPVPLSAATRELRTRFAWRGRAERRRRCRDLLHGRDALIAWERRAWAHRDAWRAPEARRALRTAVFDRAAAVTCRGRVWAGQGAISRWAFA